MREAYPEPIKVATSEDTQAIASLLAQLSSSAPPFAQTDLEAMVADPAITILAARAGGEIVGITTLVVFRVATGVRAFIDDVVVRDAHRGKGLGEKLVRAAIGQAASLGVQKIDLTSRPSREAANRLYQRLGFEQRETNVYRLVLSAKAAVP
ncbi:GNAT family N-acetyltransferase [Pseudorhizobium marinum]|uniref:GNAT family N-acetyltransferase n=1 Tax=Pseudorhizobium marinum TaxID=1496690 RepID=UPI0004986B96|nr:GNAT family N-acetyltransferase [Pseudorhizobium marinum]